MNEWGNMLKAILFPQESSCHICDRGLQWPGILCAECSDGLEKQRIAAAGAALRGAPPLQWCVAAWHHREQARELVHQLKYGASSRAGELLAEGMVRTMLEQPALLESIDVVTPVPLHVLRERERGYNQAQILASSFCQMMGLPLEENLLLRTRYTKSQVHHNRAQRLQAMKNVFSAADPKQIANRRILLVDDVYTTGSTASACAKALIAAGASEVSILTACRA